jgi:hypothetical protein
MPAPINRRRQANYVLDILALSFAALAVMGLVGCGVFALLSGIIPLRAPVGIRAPMSTPAQASISNLAWVRAPTATPHPTSTATLVLTATAPPTATATPAPTSTPAPEPTAASVPAATLPPTPTATPQPGIAHVVIISIDGLRPDALEQADTPILDELRAAGAYSPDAQSVYISYTLPGHASMFTGMTPDKHGLNFPHPYIDWPGLNGQTLFSIAHDAGLETAMVVGKKKFDLLVLPNSVDRLFTADVNDPDVRDKAIEFIEEGLSGVLFIHFPDTDRVGHTYGWMSPNQLQAIASVDSLVGEILAALEVGSYLDSTLLIVTADHGGHYFQHGDDSPVDRTIPWLAFGPGVPPGVTLASKINIYDTAATVLQALELPIPEEWDGRPVLEIFQHTESKKPPPRQELSSAVMPPVALIRHAQTARALRPERSHG